MLKLISESFEIRKMSETLVVPSSNNDLLIWFSVDVDSCYYNNTCPDYAKCGVLPGATEAVCFCPADLVEESCLCEYLFIKIISVHTTNAKIKLK